MDKEKLKYFEKRVDHWVKYFGLYNWEIGVRTDKGDGELAFTTFIVDNRRADICLCDCWEEDMTEYELDKTAFHEVVEILLLKLRHLAGKREYSFEEVDGEIHSIIRILTAKIFEKEIKCQK